MKEKTGKTRLITKKVPVFLLSNWTAIINIKCNDIKNGPDKKCIKSDDAFKVFSQISRLK